MDKSAKCDNIIHQHVAWAAGAGLIPVPAADFVVVSGIQLHMLQQMSKLYGIPFSETDIKARLSMLVGAGITRILANVIKIVPGVGSVVGGAASAIASGASTYAVGEVLQQHFESGGDWFNLDGDETKKKYKKAYDKGTEVAKKAVKQRKKKKDDDEDDDADPEETLKDLQEMLDEGVITKAEFQKMKKYLTK